MEACEIVFLIFLLVIVCIATFVDILLDTATVVDQVVALLHGVVDQSPVFVHFLIIIRIMMMLMMLMLVVSCKK